MLIAGGGTGGHLFPGIAVAQELVRRHDAEVRFVGSHHGIERTAVPRAGFTVELLPVRGVMGQGLAGLLRAVWRVPRSLVSAWALLRNFRPQVVVGVGGYAAFPALLVAVLRRCPIVLLEQNAKPGMVTRLFAPLAQVVCASFPQTIEELGARARLTGNPIRWSAGAERDSGQAGDPFCILIFGGSAGAHSLNTVAPAALARLGPGLRVVHQTGTRDLQEVSRRYREVGLSAEVVAFIEDMQAAYTDCDLALCRAGATTLAEITALGVASILVPYPFAAADHQRANAQSLADAGAAWMVLDRDLDEESLGALLEEIRGDPEGLRRKRRQALSLGRPDALATVTALCREVALGSPPATADSEEA